LLLHIMTSIAPTMVEQPQCIFPFIQQEFHAAMPGACRFPPIGDYRQLWPQLPHNNFFSPVRARAGGLKRLKRRDSDPELALPQPLPWRVPCCRSTLGRRPMPARLLLVAANALKHAQGVHII
jgi:hypothetical protein